MDSAPASVATPGSLGPAQPIQTMAENPCDELEQPAPASIMPYSDVEHKTEAAGTEQGECTIPPPASIDAAAVGPNSLLYIQEGLKRPTGSSPSPPPDAPTEASEPVASAPPVPPEPPAPSAATEPTARSAAVIAAATAQQAMTFAHPSLIELACQHLLRYGTATPSGPVGQSLGSQLQDSHPLRLPPQLQPSAYAAAAAAEAAQAAAADMLAMFRNGGSAPRRQPHVATKSNKAVPVGEGGTFTSLFRGVTRHRLTGRYEAHFWDASARREKVGKNGRTRGRQVYLGGYEREEDAARAYDITALAFLGPTAPTNFALEEYAHEMAEMSGKPPEEIVAALRRGSVGFARGQSQYRGVTKHHDQGKWEARIGGQRVEGNKYIYLGTFGSAEEAARAYDRAAVKFHGKKALTNYPITDYVDVMTDPEAYPINEPAGAEPTAAAAAAAVATSADINAANADLQADIHRALLSQLRSRAAAPQPPAALPPAKLPPPALPPKVHRAAAKFDRSAERAEERAAKRAVRALERAVERKDREVEEAEAEAFVYEPPRPVVPRTRPGGRNIRLPARYLDQEEPEVEPEAAPVMHLSVKRGRPAWHQRSETPPPRSRSPPPAPAVSDDAALRAAALMAAFGLDEVPMHLSAGGNMAFAFAAGEGQEGAPVAKQAQQQPEEGRERQRAESEEDGGAAVLNPVPAAAAFAAKGGAEAGSGLVHVKASAASVSQSEEENVSSVPASSASASMQRPSTAAAVYTAAARAAILRRGMPHQGGSDPSWPAKLVDIQFFAPCARHAAEPKNECHFYCVGCTPTTKQPMCQHCLPEHMERCDAACCRVYRCNYSDAIRTNDFGRLLHLNDVQSYKTSNGELVVHLRPRRQPNAKCPSGFTAECGGCSRAMMPQWSYCSLQCKLRTVGLGGVGGTGNAAAWTAAASGSLPSVDGKRRFSGSESEGERKRIRADEGAASAVPGGGGRRKAVPRHASFE